MSRDFATQILLLDPLTLATIQSIQVGRGYPITLSPTEKWIAMADEGLIKLFDLETGAQRSWRGAGHESWIRALCFSPDGATLASASTDSRIRLWSVATTDRLLEMVGLQDGAWLSWRPGRLPVGDDAGLRAHTFASETDFRAWSAHEIRVACANRGHSPELRQKDF